MLPAAKIAKHSLYTEGASFASDSFVSHLSLFGTLTLPNTEDT